MGRGIAYAGAINGIEVTLYDISENALNLAKAEIEKTINVSADKGFITKEQQEAGNRNITFDTNLERSAKEADIVIEAVLEKVDLKIEVFQKLDLICPLHTILATN